jgi:uncharacterized protein (TIGR02996 family)
MMDEKAFIENIISQPEDDHPRLVFADWLDEQNREEFAANLRNHQLLESARRWARTQAKIRTEDNSLPIDFGTPRFWTIYDIINGANSTLEEYLKSCKRQIQFQQLIEQVQIAERKRQEEMYTAFQKSIEQILAETRYHNPVVVSHIHDSVTLEIHERPGERPSVSTNPLINFVNKGRSKLGKLLSLSCEKRKGPDDPIRTH